MHVLVLTVDLHLPHSQSLKAKRSVVLSAVRTLDNWKAVAAAEVDHLDKWQRSGLGISIVGGTVKHVEEVADSVERFLWSLSGAEVLQIDSSWWEQL